MLANSPVLDMEADFATRRNQVVIGAEWLRYQCVEWAAIPDVIDGTEEQNDELLTEWALPGEVSVPVYHLHESLCRLGASLDRRRRWHATRHEITRMTDLTKQQNTAIRGQPILRTEYESIYVRRNSANRGAG